MNTRAVLSVISDFPGSEYGLSDLPAWFYWHVESAPWGMSPTMPPDSSEQKERAEEQGVAVCLSHLRVDGRQAGVCHPAFGLLDVPISESLSAGAHITQPPPR